MSAILPKIADTCPFLWSHRTSPHLAPLLHLVEAIDALKALTPANDFRSLTVPRHVQFKPTDKAPLLIGASLARSLKSSLFFNAENLEVFSASLRYGIFKETKLRKHNNPFKDILKEFETSLQITFATFYENELVPNAKETLDNFSKKFGGGIITHSSPQLAEMSESSAPDQSSSKTPATLVKMIGEEIAEICRLHEEAIGNISAKLIEGFLDTYTPPEIDWPLSKSRRQSHDGLAKGAAALSLSRHLAPWVFMPALNGQRDCVEKSKRRLQAYAVYGILFEGLIDPEISRLIDEGKLIETQLRDLLGLNGHQLRFAKEVAARADLLNTLRGTPQTTRVIVMLAASGVPLSHWPEVFSNFNVPQDVSAHDSIWIDPWETNFSLKAAAQDGYRARRSRDWDDGKVSLIPEIYWKALPKEPASTSHEHRDACHQLERDVLWPADNRTDAMDGGLAETIYKMINCPGPRKIACAAHDPPNQTSGARYTSEVYASARALYHTIHAAVVGDKTRSGFRKALLELHKFSPSIAAKRHELLGHEETWPALFNPWRSEDGRREIVFLKSASELVEEGLRMRHCVGSYDRQCAKGTTHIASVKVDGNHVATLEMRVSLPSDRNTLIIKKGQFASLRNAEPPPGAQRAFAEFMRDVAERRFLPNMTEVAAQIKRNVSSERYGHSFGSPNMRPLNIDKSEGLWPIYRSTILTSYPEANSLREWRKASGIEDAFRRLEFAIEQERKEIAEIEECLGALARGHAV